jgi:hypothetical protein
MRPNVARTSGPAPAMRSIIPAAAVSHDLIRALDARTREDPLLAHQEGHLKVETMRTLLTLGYTLQEGAPRADVAHFASPGTERLDVPRWTVGPRMVRVADGSSDIVILRDGAYRQLELKTRCDHGAKSGAATREIAADLVRVAQSDEFTFVGVFDGDIYRSFSGDKIERRGRKASIPGLTAVFPPTHMLLPGEVHEIKFDLDSAPFEARLVRQEVLGTGTRIIVVVDRSQGA